MKTKIVKIILAACLGIAGCSASKEGRSGADSNSLATDTMMSTPDSAATDSTMLPDSTRQDTMRTPPL